VMMMETRALEVRVSTNHVSSSDERVQYSY
jgi:hypothetical protein